MGAEFAEQPAYVNDYVYGMARDIFLYEREEGFSISAGTEKKISVLMPQPWGSLMLVAKLEGGFQSEFDVVGLTAELDDGRSRHSNTFSEEWLEKPDAYNQIFITALENFSQHDHSICLLTYTEPGTMTMPERPSGFYTSDAAVVTYPKGSLLEWLIAREESEQAELYWEQAHAAGE